MSRLRNIATKKARIIGSFFEPKYNHFLTQPTVKVKFMSPAIRNRIQELKLTAAKNHLASLSSNQVFQQGERYFVINTLCNQINKYISEEYSAAEQYQQYINPMITSAENITQHSEECVSVPCFSIKVNRFNKIKVSYRNGESPQERQKQLTEFGARIFQHELDHMHAKHILDWQNHLATLKFDPKLQKQFPKTSHIVVDFNEKLTKTFKQYPQLIKPPSLETINDKYVINDKQWISYENDYVKRLIKHFNKQNAMYVARQSIKQ